MPQVYCKLEMCTHVQSMSSTQGFIDFMKGMVIFLFCVAMMMMQLDPKSWVYDKNIGSEKQFCGG